MWDNHLTRTNYGDGEQRAPRPMLGGGNPNAGRLLWEWATGSGPDQRILGADTAFAREFSASPSVQTNLKRAARDWRDRRGGAIADGDSYTGYGAKFGAAEYRRDAAPLNSASQFVGSFALDGERHGDRLYWTARNKTGLHSLGAGRLIDENAPGLRGLNDRESGGPLSNKYQRIDLITDLDGNPIR